MPVGGGRKGYVASYVGAVAPIAASITFVVLPLSIYARGNSAQLELGGFFFVFLAMVALIGGFLLVPLGIYMALNLRGYRDAGRTTRAVAVIALAFMGFAYVGGLIGDAVVAGSVPADVASGVFVLGLVVAPFCGRWYVINFPREHGQKPYSGNATA